MKEIERTQNFDLKILSSVKEVEALEIKKEFFKQSSKFYTIVILDLSENISIRQFTKRYYLDDNYYNIRVKGKERIFYGAYLSSKEAKIAIEALHPHLQKMHLLVDLIKNQKLLYKK